MTSIISCLLFQAFNAGRAIFFLKKVIVDLQKKKLKKYFIVKEYIIFNFLIKI